MSRISVNSHYRFIDRSNEKHTRSKTITLCVDEPKIHSDIHSAYVRDLDDNKICFYTRQF